jgi:hypothetical protein
MATLGFCQAWLGDLWASIPFCQASLPLRRMVFEGLLSGGPNTNISLFPPCYTCYNFEKKKKIFFCLYVCLQVEPTSGPLEGGRALTIKGSDFSRQINLPLPVTGSDSTRRSIQLPNVTVCDQPCAIANHTYYVTPSRWVSTLFVCIAFI